LPGLFGDVGVSGLFPIPAATLRAVIEACDNPALESAWTDDTTLGWVYQFWNDPEREALDDKVNNGGKIERHEVAAKTQLFTDRYMVEWLLQNSLGQQWLAICMKHGWTPEARASGALNVLEERRQIWRARRAAGEVLPETMMPIESEEEQRWKYWVPQPLPREAVEAAPETIRTFKMLDPAVGSGHFLLIAFDLLTAFYQEEARHRGEFWTPKQIAESILENNLHGVDLDPRAVQLAAAALWLKAKTFCRDAEPHVINLVASNFGFASLPDVDLAVQELRREVQKAAGIPEALTDTIIHALKGADHLGTLLKVDEAVEAAIREHERTASLVRTEYSQGDIFTGFRPQQTLLSFDEAKVSVLEQLDKFLAKCTGGEDLGLRLRGEQFAAGVRFVRLVNTASYHLVIANPPYHSAAKLAAPDEFQKLYPEGGADLFSAFMQRTLQLVKPHCLAATVTLSNWLYLGTYEELRSYLMDSASIVLLADLGKAAFSSGSMLINASMNIIQRTPNKAATSLAVRPFAPKDVIVDPRQVLRNAAVLLSGAALFHFQAHKLRTIIKGQPLIYWWDDAFLKRYAGTPKLGDEAPGKYGINTGNNTRFLRKLWEVSIADIQSLLLGSTSKPMNVKWHRYLKGSGGKTWIDPCDDIGLWLNNGLEIKLFAEYIYHSYSRQIRNEPYYFRPGVAFSMIGSSFTGRAHRFRCLIDSMGSSVFTEDIPNIVCLMNSSIARSVLQSLNPTVHFQIGDVNRLPLFLIESANEIFAKLDAAFTEHEAARETSVEFKHPSPSAWSYVQEWAQTAVDREPGTPLPAYQPVHADPLATYYISYAIGVALGRFGANGEGILNVAPAMALPAGILYLSAYADNDSLQHPSCQPITEAWARHEDAIARGTSLHTWLRQSFFSDVHLGMYDNRPIYFPLSSQRKNFVALVSIHRWADNTLQILLTEYLLPELHQLEGALHDLIAARNQSHREAQAEAENSYNKVKTLYDELKNFIDLVQQCAETGPPPARPQDTPREMNACFTMDLDDGVMINSAALWPLLESQWKHPRTWWSELCNAKGKKDYDWAHLTARYFPTRVDTKCRHDPSLAVAHGCFWTYHPEKAYEWELRLQDEIGPDFTIDEAHSDALRAQFEAAYPNKVKALIAAEHKRRASNRKKARQGSGKGAKDIHVTSSDDAQFFALTSALSQKETEHGMENEA
jgi:hypothetical protein